MKVLTHEYSSELVDEARSARERAYAPYSNFKVGAALRTKSGKVFRGGNVENASFSMTICAERSAGVAAIADGEMDWEELVVVADTAQPTTPCGACRQFLAEFNQDLKVVVANNEKVFFTCTVADLLPHAFDQDIMETQKS
ncbi:MAG TPA: cytidine deaminase [Chloroflexia bacterium]|nr:cytidine deaminase [Chloroflexia bacterium]